MVSGMKIALDQNLPSDICLSVEPGGNSKWNSGVQRLTMGTYYLNGSRAMDRAFLRPSAGTR
jgi:hypothetical protein